MQGFHLPLLLGLDLYGLDMFPLIVATVCLQNILLAKRLESSKWGDHQEMFVAWGEEEMGKLGFLRMDCLSTHLMEFGGMGVEVLHKRLKTFVRMKLALELDSVHYFLYREYCHHIVLKLILPSQPHNNLE